MTCPACGADNREGARFCDACGAGLVLACAGCGAEPRPGARFCDACGRPVAATQIEAFRERDPRSYTPKYLAEKILPSKSALEGERKQVTVLFADVKGSVELTGALDPEEWRGGPRNDLRQTRRVRRPSGRSERRWDRGRARASVGRERPRGPLARSLPG